MDDFLIIKALLINGQHGRIRQDVIQEVGTHSAGIAKIADLYRCQPRGEGRKPGILGVALQVNGNINARLARCCDDRAIGKPGTFMEMIHRGAGAGAHCVFNFWTIGKGMDFEGVSVVAFQHAGKQLHGRVIVQIRREIPNAQPITLCGGRRFGNGRAR